MATLSNPDSRMRFNAPLLSEGTVLQNRYRIVRELGSGGMGAVYEAIDQRLGATVALKETFSANERLRRQFEQEARLLAHLHHPSLPRVSDYFTEDGRAFLVMQFIAGDDLAEVISNQNAPFPQTQVIAWADQLLDALIYLHTRERQIIHRDIKPHNLKLTDSGHIALLDFGLAKAHSPDQSTTQSCHSIFGYTRRYSPLEQMQDQGTSPQSDIYALGATLYHLLTGAKPPDALVRARALANSKSDPLQPANEINPVVGNELAVMLQKAMALSAADRFESAVEFREALRQLGRRDVQESSDVINASRSRASDTDRQTGSDPFDSYSILKPQPSFGISVRTRGPLIIVAAVAIILVTLVAAVPNTIIESLSTLLSASKVTSPPPHASVPALRPARSDLAATKPSIKPAPSPASLGRTHREPQKARQRRTTAISNDPKPPPFSIEP